MRYKNNTLNIMGHSSPHVTLETTIAPHGPLEVCELLL